MSNKLFTDISVSKVWKVLNILSSCIDNIQLSVSVRHNKNKGTCRNVSCLFLQVRKPSWCLVGRIIMLLSGRSRMGRYVCTVTINMDTYANNISGLFLLRNTLDKILNNKSTAFKNGFVFNKHKGEFLAPPPLPLLCSGLYINFHLSFSIPFCLLEYILNNSQLRQIPYVKKTLSDNTLTVITKCN